MNIKITKYVAAVGLATFITSSTSAFASDVTVEKGNTLYSISTKYKISIDELKKINHLTSNTLYIGQVLKLTPETSVNTTNTTYTVVRGDTLYKIALSYKLSVSELKNLNNLSSDTLYVGQKLIVSKNAPVLVTEPTPVVSPVAPPAPTSPVTVDSLDTYTVVRGDTLWGISLKTGLSVDELKKINTLSTNILTIGQVLYLKESTTSKVDRILEDAKKLIGVPYLWGGNTPRGFDCSGFTSYVFSLSGVNIPRVSKDQFAHGKTVTIPQPGDLVFFSTYTTGPSHVGIYLGDNKMIQSGSSTGVTISDINGSYWKPRFIGFKRYEF